MLTLPSSHVPSAYLISDISLLSKTAAVSGVGIEGWKGQKNTAGKQKQLEQKRFRGNFLKLSVKQSRVSPNPVSF